MISKCNFDMEDNQVWSKTLEGVFKEKLLIISIQKYTFTKKKYHKETH